MMPRSVICLLLSIGLFLASYSCKPNPAKNTNNNNISKVVPKKLNVNDFEQKLAATTNAQLVDVRTPAEYNDGHLKGALNINYQDNSFTDEVAKLDKTKPVFVYCQMGGRSKEACNYMSNQGFTEIYEMENGFNAWQHFNKPFEQ